MKCPYCGSDKSSVLDSRTAENINATARRRECLSCGEKFSTIEILRPTNLNQKPTKNKKQFHEDLQFLRSFSEAGCTRITGKKLAKLSETVKRMIPALETVLPVVDLGICRRARIKKGAVAPNE